MTRSVSLGLVPELATKYVKAFGLRHALAFAWLKVREASTLRSIGWKGHVIHLRPGTSDTNTFIQVLYYREYDVTLTRAPEVILDAGANIGLSVLWFANRYPDARIVALEPEPDNFALLQRNTSHLTNVSCHRAALWGRTEDVVISDPGLGTWGFRTTNEPAGPGAITAPGLTIDDLFARFDIDRINLLKVDIEGAEREVFARRPHELGRVDVIAIELHDRVDPICSRAFFSAVDGELGSQLRLGEHVWVFREGWGPQPSQP